MALPRGVLGWSVVCDCGISWSYTHFLNFVEFLCYQVPLFAPVNIYIGETQIKSMCRVVRVSSYKVRYFHK